MIKTNIPNLNGEELSKQLEEFNKLLAENSARIMANPNADGWIRFLEILREASRDKRIISSDGASGFIAVMVELVSDCLTSSTVEQTLEPLLKIFESGRASNNANKRFEKLREAEAWVIDEWSAHKVAYKGNKTEFASHYVARLRHERSVKISVRNICERWLKGR